MSCKTFESLLHLGSMATRACRLTHDSDKNAKLGAAHVAQNTETCWFWSVQGSSPSRPTFRCALAPDCGWGALWGGVLLLVRCRCVAQHALWECIPKESVQLARLTTSGSRGISLSAQSSCVGTVKLRYIDITVKHALLYGGKKYIVFYGRQVVESHYFVIV